MFEIFKLLSRSIYRFINYIYKNYIYKLNKHFLRITTSTSEIERVLLN